MIGTEWKWNCHRQDGMGLGNGRSTGKIDGYRNGKLSDDDANPAGLA